MRIRLILVPFSLLALSVIACPGLGNISGASKAEAERQAKVWAKEMGLKAEKISCAGTDSDGDGYVSCSFNVDGQIQTFECAGAMNLNSGCRQPKINVNRR